ncbi:putative metalloprotease CJM1_0395 family protein [Vogesella sp. DC21W]|uniref:Metalloprotease CJM1_0395 family protein n=1 Tax=Vogesella aquatica TaxID=2984206 RepID=A0ABT5IXP3_9NEIS|nr:putative metalloprotease CJM1_0395 family protein [Vogesella aquatica]MDC7717344.1 putative metalloprotease CJM1_0395 family protein [Vogesella aquatica]
MSISASTAANYGSPYANPASPASGTGRGQSGTVALSEEEEKQVEKLKARDSEVRAHEQAHMAAAGGVSVSGPSYSYQQGPDGKRYAVGGNVSIDASPGRTPEDTLRKAQAVQRAALAPAEPSGQDQAVAAQARQMALQAMAEQAAARQAGNSIEKTYQPQDSTAPALQGRGIDTQA